MIGAATKVRLKRILDGYVYAYSELVKTQTSQITLEEEFVEADSKVLSHLQNDTMVCLAKLEEFCAQFGIVKGKPMPSITESTYSSSGRIEKKTVWADDEKTEKLSEAVYTYDSGSKRLLSVQTTTFGAVGGEDAVETASYSESVADGKKTLIEEKS